jgi:hypothetical protein
MKCSFCGYEWKYTARNEVKRKYIVCPVCRANLKNPDWTQNIKGKGGLKEIKEVIGPILSKYHVKRAVIFGSFARGEQHKDSDLDLLVEFDYDKMDGLDYMRLWKELEEKLGMKVDLVSWDYLNPLLKEDVKKEGIEAI